MEVFARDYLKRAGERLIDADAALGRGSYPEVVRYAQEATELSLKAALRFIGVEYPKVHDVGPVLARYAERFGKKFASEIPWMVEFSGTMAAKRSAALCGLEAAGKPPGEIFKDSAEAKESLNGARRVRKLCGSVLK